MERTTGVKSLPASDHTALAERTLRTLARQSRLRSSMHIGGEANLVALTSVVETYVDNVLRALIAESDVARHPFIAAMYSELEDHIFQSWTNRYRWLSDGFAISVSGSTPEQEMHTLVELRNCIVHGNGRLTDRQVRDLPKMIELEHQLSRVLHVTVERRRIHLSERTFISAVQVCRAFVVALDGELRMQHPDLRVGPSA